MFTGGEFTDLDFEKPMAKGLWLKRSEGLAPQVLEFPCFHSPIGPPILDISGSSVAAAMIHLGPRLVFWWLSPRELVSYWCRHVSPLVSWCRLQWLEPPALDHVGCSKMGRGGLEPNFCRRWDCSPPSPWSRSPWLRGEVSRGG